jgi:PAS domain S-box-containing protein
MTDTRSPDLRETVISLDVTGYVTDWSAGAENLFGYTRAEAVGQHVLFLYADEPGEGEGDMPELFLGQGGSTVKVRRRKKSGQVFWATLTLDLQHDVDGTQVGMVARLSDVFESLSPSDQLQLHASIIENSDQGILITDADERIVSVNAAFSQITGYSPNEAIGETIDLLRSGVHDADFQHAGAGRHCRVLAPGMARSSASARTVSCSRNRSPSAWCATRRAR